MSTQFNGVIHSMITIQCIGTLPGDTLDTVITPIIVQNENIGSIVWWKGSNLVDMSNTTKYSGGSLANPALTIMDLIDSDESGYECTCSANSFNPIPLRVVIGKLQFTAFHNFSFLKISDVHVLFLRLIVHVFVFFWALDPLICEFYYPLTPVLSEKRIGNRLYTLYSTDSFYKYCFAYTCVIAWVLI